MIHADGQGLVEVNPWSETRKLDTDDRRWRFSHRHHSANRYLLLRGVQGEKAVADDVEIEPPGNQQLRMVDLRAALLDRYVQPMLCIETGCQRLIEPIVFRLRPADRNQPSPCRRRAWRRTSEGSAP